MDENRTAQPAGSAGDPAALCTLSADGLSDRLAWIRQEILPHAIESARLERGLAFELVAVPGLAEKIDQLILLERECCSSLQLERKESGHPGRLRLEVRGIDPDAPIFRALRIRSAQPSRRARLAKAAGAGVLTSVFVCCVLPVAGATLLGATTLPLLTPLDGPGPIAAGALLAGAVAWRWLGRQQRRETARSLRRGASCGSGC